MACVHTSIGAAVEVVASFTARCCSTCCRPCLSDVFRFYFCGPVATGREHPASSRSGIECLKTSCWDQQHQSARNTLVKPAARQLELRPCDRCCRTTGWKPNVINTAVVPELGSGLKGSLFRAVINWH